MIYKFLETYELQVTCQENVIECSGRVRFMLKLELNTK